MNRLVFGGIVGGLIAMAVSITGCGSSPCSDLSACAACASNSTCQALITQGNADQCKMALDAFNQLNACSGPVNPPDGGGMDLPIPPDVPNGHDVPIPPPPDQGGQDIIIVNDNTPPPPDSTTGTGPSTANVGKDCTPNTSMPPQDPANCGSDRSQICLPSQMDMTHGFCTVAGCDNSNPTTSCGMNNFCVLPLTQQAPVIYGCVEGCTVAGNNCGSNTTCQPLLGTQSICFLPGCAMDSDCTDAMGNPDPTKYCDTVIKSCENKGKAGALVGDACMTDADCTKNGVCLAQATFGFFGGYCTVPECDGTAVDPGFACDSGSTCQNVGIQLCLKNCTADTDCRQGPTKPAYSCQQGACLPAPCTADADCVDYGTGFTCMMQGGMGFCAPPAM
jgi:hypothetical protein